MSGMCKVDGCDLEVIAQGLCHLHYDRWRRGEAEIVKFMGGPFKSIRGVRPVNKQALVKRALKNASAAREKDKAIGPGSEVVKKIVEKASASQNGRVQALADEHWDFVKGLLETHVVMEPDFLKQIEYHYKTALMHGYKHGVNDRERPVQG